MGGPEGRRHGRDSPKRRRNDPAAVRAVLFVKPTTLASWHRKRWTRLEEPSLVVASPPTVPMLPGGFAHGPASLTSSTAQPSGILQLVTVSKAYTSLAGAFPELPVIGFLDLHFVPEPGTLMLLGLGVMGLAAVGRRRPPD